MVYSAPDVRRGSIFLKFVESRLAEGALEGTSRFFGRVFRGRQHHRRGRSSRGRGALASQCAGPQVAGGAIDFSVTAFADEEGDQRGRHLSQSHCYILRYTLALYFVIYQSTILRDLT